MRKQKIVNILQFIVPVLAATALWGTAAPVIKLTFGLLEIDANNVWQQFFFAGARFVPAGALALACMAVQGKPVLLPKGSWRGVALMGLFQIGIHYAFYFYGLAHTTSVRGSILNATSVFFSVAAAHLLGVERINLRRTLGCLCGFAGILVLQLGKGSAGGFNFAGDGMLLLGALFSGGTKPIAKRVMRNVSPVLANGWQLIFGGVVVLALGIVGGGWFGAYPLAGLICFAYLIFVSMAAFSLWMMLLKKYSVGSVVVCSFLTPVFSSLFTAILIPSENAFALRNVISLALICLGVIIVNLQLQRREKA